ncbi:sulfur carrier protein ThiS [Paenibacillus profundus]|uniref:Sulfur carrier protein ThiS n=1 Tax=Paenibacillus profundus TaxID=1173085 RepID=A0ABS8YNS1_9BACL|nr:MULTISPECIES: sulfur carrier protein ThiS [Paenibacillus]MCE5172103.1 sulfur carrier protein ThiS [Paenibacillus profundus]
MQITVNGEVMELPEMTMTVQHLLAHLQMENRIVVVELNQSIVHKSDHAKTGLANGDRVEIVHFVGGG